MFLERRLTAMWLLDVQRNHSNAKERPAMRRIAAMTRNPLIVALFLTLAVAGCANKKTPNTAADLGLGAGAATPGSSQDFTVNVGDRIFFDTDSSIIRADAQGILARQAQWLNQYKQYAIVIEGHADERGTR
jgi:peptidoglycan-associated lipoprotein